MKTTEQHPVASIASPTGNSFDGYGVPALAVITPPTILQSESAIQADPPVDEHASDRTFTAEECSSLSMRHLRRLCDEAFTELDVDFPEWGVRDRYDMLCAEVTARADALRNHPNSRGAGRAREVFRDNVGNAAPAVLRSGFISLTQHRRTFILNSLPQTLAQIRYRRIMQGAS